MCLDSKNRETNFSGSLKQHQTSLPSLKSPGKENSKNNCIFPIRCSRKEEIKKIGIVMLQYFCLFSWWSLDFAACTR